MNTTFKDYEELLFKAKDELNKSITKKIKEKSTKTTKRKKIHSELIELFNNCAMYFERLEENIDFIKDNQNYQIFKPFNKDFISCAIYEDNDCIKILPYLITSYYLNLYKTNENGIPASIENIFIKENIDYENLTRDKNYVVNLFSLEDKIEKFIKKKKSDFPSPIRNIKDREKYIDYLSKPHFEKNSTLCKDFKVTSLQFEHIYLAYIYSIFTLACMNAGDKISQKIDYAASFNLFNQHTFAFYSIFACSLKDIDDECECIYKKENPYDFFEISTPLITYLEQIQNISHIRNFFIDIKNTSKTPRLKDIGIDIKLYTLHSTNDSQKWYKNSALFTAIIFHYDAYIPFREYLKACNNPKIL